MAQGSRIYTVEFRGRAEVIRRTQSQEPLPNESQIVRNLNDNSTLIAQTIGDQLTGGLSPSLSVQVQIHFYEGSISFAGVIILLDAMGSLADSPEFLATFSRLVEIVIQSVLQKWILDELDANIFTISTQVEVKQPMHRRSGGWMSFQNLAILMLANTVLLLILILLLLPSTLPNPTPTSTSTWTPTSTLTFTPTLTPSLTPTLTPSWTPSPTNTKTPTNTFTPTITPFP